ncbi:MAG: SAM-dependent methyltransferase [Myxococcales bacterium]|nr:SAM-dependent methyltransferase [Myxococcales bacterium]
MNVTPPTPTRQVICGDALAWLAANPATPAASLVASLPDVSEVGSSEERWRELFADAVALSLNAIPPHGVAVFFQTDLKRDGRWISKAGMVLAAAERSGVPLLWHKLVCRQAPGRIQHGRPAYSHLLAFSREARDDSRVASADVLPDLGEMPWTHSMGSRAAFAAVDFIRRASPETTTILAPFCGLGTVLSAANRRGFSAIGIEQTRKRAERAATFELADDAVPRLSRSERRDEYQRLVRAARETSAS